MRISLTQSPRTECPSNQTLPQSSQTYRDQCQFYEDKKYAGSSEPENKYNASLQASGLAMALEKEKFRLYCQPIFAIDNGKREIVNYEVLLRLIDDDGKIYFLVLLFRQLNDMD